MKLKKLLISASVLAASSGLLATVLTSCAKQDIEDKYKVTLSDTGLFVKDVTFKDAIQKALSTATTWTEFKKALADELIYKWYVDRAAPNKDSDTKNSTFRTNLDDWEYQIKKDYDSVVDSCKSKYGANYKFYLQNEYLSANGGTEQSYKDAKLREKVRAEFINNVFANNYFGYRAGDEAEKYPHIFTKASSKIDDLHLRNPLSWTKLGFYATTNTNFDVDDATDPNKLAAKPDGDYAIIQDYVFNRWFATEKPFFSAAALFKYSKPAESGASLANIYNPNKVTVPDEPNETYPFFGGIALESNDGFKGTMAYWHWYDALVKGIFGAAGRYEDDTKFNGTLSIPTKYTEDSQTLLLCYGSQMIAGSSGTLYTPYAISAMSLYNQLMGVTGAAPLNTIDQSTLATNVDLANKPQGEDDARILKNFFYVNPPAAAYTKSVIDLNAIYGGLDDKGTPADPSDDEYHCPIFLKPDGRISNYEFFYGNDSTNGVRYITNNVQVDLSYNDPATNAAHTQPWVLELNEAGMHAQTIDGYEYVKDKNLWPTTTQYSTPSEALKDVVKYRLMQDLQGYDGDLVSADAFGDSGKLKTYFQDNLTDIILELAFSEKKEANIFREIATYKDGYEPAEGKLFLKLICDEQFLGAKATLVEYLKVINQYDTKKKVYDAIIAANDKIYSYRTTQIQNTKNQLGKKRFENGLLAPLAINVSTSDETAFNTTHNYAGVTDLLINDNVVGALTIDALTDILETTLPDNDFVKSVANATVDGNTAFCPQIAAAKKVLSNRFWFKSTIVDRFMYQAMSSSNLANAIKMTAYEQYTGKVFSDADDFDFAEVRVGAKKAISSTFKAKKLMTGDKNYASYPTPVADQSFWSVIDTAYGYYAQKNIADNGSYSDNAVQEYLLGATIAYLAKNNFENFYKSLNSKIAEDEMAFVGYLTKYNNNYTNAEIGYDPTAPKDATGTPYKWQANVDNIFDQLHYSGTTGTAPAKIENAKVACDQYWNVVTQTSGQDFAGFLGLQTKSSNSINADSGLQSALFDKLSRSTRGSKDYSGTAHNQNDGVLFAWAGTRDNTGKLYTFDDVKDPRSTPEADITWKSFANEEGTGYLPAGLKLARKIANCSTLDDLRTLARTLSNVIDGYTIFRDIGNNQYHIEVPSQAVTEVKYQMLKELLSVKEGTQESKYAPYFERLVQTELHTDPMQGNEYCFETGSDGYRLMVTQINKADIVEKRITPTYETDHWEMGDNAGLLLEEFWFIFTSMACEASIQQLAIADTVKTLYGENKLEVYDAQLYNQFDSVWIKDWEKKPIGGEGA